MGVKVVYATTYGSTKQYAQELARRLHTDASDIHDLDPTFVTDSWSGPLVVLSPVHGPVNEGAKFIVDAGETTRPVALCTVGMTLDDVAVKKDGAARVLGAATDRVRRFYLPGRLSYSELTPAHRSTMWTIVTMLKVKPMKSTNDRMMIETFDRDVDRVDLSRLDAVEGWVHANGG
jgi:hypothetical protein